MRILPAEEQRAYPLSALSAQLLREVPLSESTPLDHVPQREPGAHITLDQLVTVVQALSLARDLPTVMEIVRHAARALTGADGATFILRDGEMCYYAEEDAIAPLWKGQRFPMTACISGWTMLNREQAIIRDIYADPRIPHDAYRPTFVKSLVMVPIRKADPIGAIGNYWAEHHGATPEEVRVLQALADTTAVALENIQVYADLEQRVLARTAELEAVNKELEAFTYAVSHDLRAPLRHIAGYAAMLREDYADAVGEQGVRYLSQLDKAVQRMEALIGDLLALSRTTQATLQYEPVDLSQIARDIVADLQAAEPSRHAVITIAEQLTTQGDPRLLRVVLENLLGNAWKFTRNRSTARIEVGANRATDGTVFFVRDNGAGFDMQYAGKLFGVFQRLHSEKEFPGSGIGLATVQRILVKHRGRIWAEAAADAGATFYFTLG